MSERHRDALLTVEDYRATPDDMRCQLVEGELIMSSSPSRSHQESLLNIARMIASYLERNPIGRVFIAPFDVYLSEHDVVQPDVLFLANANLNLLADDGVHGPPDLAVEVIFPSSVRLDKETKRGIYTRAGVKEFWLVDPAIQRIDIYALSQAPFQPVRTILKENETFTSMLLPGLVVEAAQVFRS